MLKFLTRVAYQLPSRPWKLEGGFGLNVFDFFKDFETVNQVSSSRNIFKVNEKLNAFARIGMSYSFNFKTKKSIPLAFNE